MSALLDVRNLAVDIPIAEGVLHPVRGIDLSVEAGRTLAIVGESGCGKSLTALAIMGLLPKNARMQADSITLEGRSLLGLSYKEWRRLRGERVAMIFQDPMTALDPCYRIGDQMLEILRQHRSISRSAGLALAEAMLVRVRIPAPSQRLSQYPHQLSGGLRQRVMIAMALLCEPVLVIADEPTTALDVTVQAEILGLLAELQQETGMGLIIVTHDLGVVTAISDDVAVMYGGQIVEAGATATVFERPLHPYTEGLMRSIPVPGGTRRDRPLGTIPGIVPRQLGPLQHCGFVARCPYAHERCRAGPVPLRRSSPDQEFRCVLAADGSDLDQASWEIPERRAE
jgi:peptide/nickel transport system ATP-binding protein